MTGHGKVFSRMLEAKSGDKLKVDLLTLKCNDVLCIINRLFSVYAHAHLGKQSWDMYDDKMPGKFWSEHR